MAKTTILTDLNGVGLGPLLGADATTPAARNAAGVLKSVTAESTNPVAWAGVATQGDGEVGLSAGALTPLTVVGGTAAMPIVVMGGKDLATSPVGRGVRIHESGILYTLPGSSWSTASPPVYQVPLMSVAGELTAAAATANQTLTNTLASNFGYMTDLQFNLYVTSTNASTLSVLDASGGTVRFLASFAASALGTTITEQVFNFHFTTPLRTNAAGAAFFLTTTGSTTQWTVRCNGYFAAV